jgi:adenylyltransferase/sulfurtransferase
MPTRYLVNDACVITGKILVSGSVFRFEGQVLSLNCPAADGNRSADYRHLFPESANTTDELDCATAGVLSMVPGIVGCIQAKEIITQFISINADGPEVKRLSIPHAVAGIKNGPATSEELINWKYHVTTCGMSVEMDAEEMFTAIQKDPNLLLLDVRMPNEFPEAEGLTTTNIPLPILEKSMQQLADAHRIIVFCKRGARSAKALELLKSKFPDKEISSLRGGIEAWNAYCEKAGTITN